MFIFSENTSVDFSVSIKVAVIGAGAMGTAVSQTIAPNANVLLYARRKEVCDSIDGWDLSKYDEVVFCGYGEPTERLDELLEVAAYIKSKDNGTKIRINTNGLADLIHGEKTAHKLKGLIDTVSISLNATNKEDYFKIVRPKFGMDSYDAMLAFTRDCVAYVPEVVMTVVDVVTTKEEQERSRKICESTGATFRIRPYESN